MTRFPCYALNLIHILVVVRARDSIHYHLFHHFALKSSSMYQVTIIKHHVYHFQFFLIDVALCQYSSQLVIKHLTPHVWLEFGVYASLCYHEVKIYIFT
jgi:hypothetical protein